MTVAKTTFAPTAFRGAILGYLLYCLVVVVMDLLSLLPAHPKDAWIRIPARCLLPFVAVFALDDAGGQEQKLTMLCFLSSLLGAILGIRFFQRKAQATQT